MDSPHKTKQGSYRVETFIIPLGNNYCSETILIKTDDAKITEKLQADKANVPVTEIELCYRNKSKHIFCSDEKNSQNVQSEMNVSNSVDKIETEYHKSKDKCTLYNLDSYFHSSNVEYPRSYENTIDAQESVRLFQKVDTLMSIEEKSEDQDERSTDFCYHGCKNGCSAIIPTPQEVSEEIFHLNWLQKLESIKHKEAALRSKELILQTREREIFKREREVRIIERRLKDKMKQMELYLKRSKSCQKTSTEDDDTEVASSKDSRFHSEDAPATTEFSNNMENSKSDRNPQDSNDERISLGMVRQVDSRKESEQERAIVYGSSCSSDVNTVIEKRIKKPLNSRAGKSSHSSVTKLVPNANGKSKKHCKVYYDDLDTTLSADAGDTTFIQTSEKFNPELYRKPFAFVRSSSERRAKVVGVRNSVSPEYQPGLFSNVESRYPSGIEEDKILKRVTKNISASQDKNTKFQHYGPIDQKIDETSRTFGIETNLRDEAKYSYLNLEVGGKFNSQATATSLKDRPTSWNGGTNAWLQKKREAYNLTMRRLPTEDFENKENFKYEMRSDKLQKTSKKKDIKNKIFTIFR